MFEAQNCIEVVLASDGLSRLGRIYANNGSHLIIATDPEDAPYFSLGADVTLVHLQEDSLYKMETTIVQCTGKGIGVPIRMARFAERRRSQRVKCEVGLLFTSRDIGSGAATQAGTLRDISQTGARIFTSVNLLGRFRDYAGRESGRFANHAAGGNYSLHPVKADRRKENTRRWPMMWRSGSSPCRALTRCTCTAIWFVTENSFSIHELTRKDTN